MKLHILGICGTFMGGIAALARELGHDVEGSDANVYPPMSTQLEQLGIVLKSGYRAEHLQPAPDLVVVGNALSRGNPAIEHVLDTRLRYVSGPQWLGETLLADRRVLAVAGTHGKTTTTSLLAWILDCAGRDPGFLVGGVPANFGVSARLGEKRGQSHFSPVSRQIADHRPKSDSDPFFPLFVIEADEYDTAFFDKRSKFVHYRPRTAIFNNLEYDHADIFPDLGAIETQFHHLVRMIPPHARIVANGSDASIARVLGRGCWSEVERFGLAEVPGNGPGWTVAMDGTILLGGAAQGTLSLELPGRHNQQNALAALAAARHVGVPVRHGLAALAKFKGVRRRMEVRGQVRGITVYDDFAHHPTAIAVSLEALRRKVGSSRIVAVLEPRSNTMKLGAMKDALPGSLAPADRVFCYDANLGWNVAGALAPLGAAATVMSDLPSLVQAIAREAAPGDHVLVMSNGGFGGIHEKLLSALQ